jgi:hypothetical protein
LLAIQGLLISLVGGGILWFAYANWRYNLTYRYAKWLQANLFGSRPTETQLERIICGGFSSGFLVLFGGAFLILGISLMLGL